MPVCYVVALKVTLALLLVGCGVGTVRAPYRPVTPPELKHFPAQDWRLVNNKLFLWREDMTPAQVTTARRISERLDELDSQALPYNRRSTELSLKIDPLKETARALGRQSRDLQSAIAKLGKRKAELVKKLTGLEKALADEKAKPVPEPAELARLAAEIEETSSQKKTVETDTATQQGRKKDVDAELGRVRITLAPLEAEMEDVARHQAEIEEKGRTKVDEIMQVVEWFKDQPTSIVFQFDRSGGIEASLSGWNLGDDAGARDLSTRPGPGGKPTLTDVTYAPAGGIFAFNAHIFADPEQKELRETYSFRVGRIKLDATDGRCFFSGEIVRRRFTRAGVETRRGIAKLVDRNN